MPTAYRKAQEKMPYRKDIILRMLRNAGEKGVTNTELQKVSLRYSACIGTYMKNQGYEIRVKNLGGGLCRYYLISEPETINYGKPENAVDILLREIEENFGGEVSSEDLVKILSRNDFYMRKKQITRGTV